jgi:hypothetical protein
LLFRSRSMVLIKYSLRSLCSEIVRPGGLYTTQITIPERGLGRRFGRMISHKHSKFSLSRSTRRIQGMYY